MKKVLGLLLGLTLTLILTMPAAAAKPAVTLTLLDEVTINTVAGTVVSTPADRTDSFNPEQPGNWGGAFGTGAVTAFPGDGDSAGYVTLYPFPGSAKAVTVHFLAGLADDSFDVNILDNRGTWVNAGHYTDDPDNINEKWISFDIASLGKRIALGEMINIQIVPTGTQWYGFNTYGQLAISKVELWGRGEGGYGAVAAETLVQKDPVTWEEIPEGASGDLLYRVSGPKFAFDFNAVDLLPATAYSLIYYADPWPGNNPGALIASGITGASGSLSLKGAAALGFSLPDPADANYPTGAKIWLVPSADYDAATKAMIAWNPANILFEYDLIQYSFIL